MVADRYVEVLGARVRYHIEGSGPPVVLIHGLGASREMWEWTTPVLRNRYTIISFDFPGLGFSDPLPTVYSPRGAGQMTLALMDAIGVSRAAFIGSSLGGGIATVAAGLAPERCTALVLAAPAGFDADLSLTMRLATIPGVGEMMLAALRRFPRLGVRDTFADPRRIPHRLIDLVRRDAIRPQYGLTILTALRSVATVRGIEPAVVEEVRAAAARVAAPTLIIWGTKDHVLPPEQADLAGRLFPHARVRRLDGVGHLPSIEAAATFNTLAMEFLSGAPR